MDLISLISLVFSDFQPGRVIESLVFLFVLWKKVGPHLTKIEDRLKGLEKAVATGFSAGEDRFIKIEDRLLILEKPIGEAHS